MHVFSEKCIALSKARQILTMSRTHVPMHIYCVMHVPLPERTDIVMGTLHIMAVADWITEICVRAGCQKTSHTISKLFVWDCLSHSLDTLWMKESSFCTALLWGMKPGKMTTPETKKHL